MPFKSFITPTKQEVLVEVDQDGDVIMKDWDKELKPSPLLILPFELQSMIYTEALINGSGSVGFRPPYHTVKIPFSKCNVDFQSGLISTCKQVYNETIPILYGVPYFIIYKDYGFIEFITSLSPFAAASVRKIGLSVDLWRHNLNIRQGFLRGRMTAYILDTIKKTFIGIRSLAVPAPFFHELDDSANHTGLHLLPGTLRELICNEPLSNRSYRGRAIEFESLLRSHPRYLPTRYWEYRFELETK